jgi:hypothetical protein
VVTLDDVAQMAMALPDVTEGMSWRRRTWFVGTRGFAWERPFTKADLQRFGNTSPPAGPIVAVRVEDLGEKEAVLAEGQRGIFTIPHFDGFPAVLVQLDVVVKRVMRNALVDAWLACAPTRLVEPFLAGGRSAYLRSLRERR